ncbi:MAG: cytosine permease [Spirochaetaceae bacterium]|jgi:putative hydroxymethylpyrimidine transporter CytX|nr:cytosine permease [Spirochaetaceae bacterium]
MNKAQASLLWLGASISISELVAGSLLAPLGFAKATAAIVAGHLVGGVLFGLAGLVSWTGKKNAMESAACVFGSRGGSLIALCNVVQLLGWTVIMVVQAARAMHGILPAAPFSLLALALSALTLVWALAFGSPARALNGVVVCLLALLCALLFAESFFPVVAGVAPSPGAGEGMSFFLAVELSVAMPVSWLPLVGDYAKDASSKAAASVVPAAAYFAGSVLMYLFGAHIAIAAGGDFFALLAASRFRFAACAVVALSTLTTAFLDLHSAAVSARFFAVAYGAKPATYALRLQAAFPRFGRFFGSGLRVRGLRSSMKTARSPTTLPLLAIGAAALALSVFFPVERYESLLELFLLAIGSVFAPVYTVVILHWAAAARGAPPAKKAPAALPAACAAACGIAAYQISARLGFPLPTAPCIAATIVFYASMTLCLPFNKRTGDT